MANSTTYRKANLAKWRKWNKAYYRRMCLRDAPKYKAMLARKKREYGERKRAA